MIFISVPGSNHYSLFMIFFNEAKNIFVNEFVGTQTVNFTLNYFYLFCEKKLELLTEFSTTKFIGNTFKICFTMFIQMQCNDIMN